VRCGGGGKSDPYLGIETKTKTRSKAVGRWLGAPPEPTVFGVTSEALSQKPAFMDPNSICVSCAILWPAHCPSVP